MSRGSATQRDDAPRVLLVTTGGTIEALGRDQLDFDGYMGTGRSVDPGELLAGLIGSGLETHVELLRMGNIPSPALTSSHWLRLLRELRRRAESCDGIVVTHGTNVLEETAIFLDLTLDVEIPVVLTGAMRPFSAVGYDGTANLVAGVRVAADSTSRGRGVLVVLGNTIHAARRVTKTASDALDAFTSPSGGPVGRIGLDGTIRYYSHFAQSSRVLKISDELDALPRVDVVLSHVDADGMLVRASVANGAKGIVLAGSGAGFPSADQWSALDEAQASGVVVCRTGRGAGAKADRNEVLEGWLAAGSLRPWQARSALAVCLAAGLGPAECQLVLDEYGV